MPMLPDGLASAPPPLVQRPVAKVSAVQPDPGTEVPCPARFHEVKHLCSCCGKASAWGVWTWRGYAWRAFPPLALSPSTEPASQHGARRARMAVRRPHVTARRSRSVLITLRFTGKPNVEVRRLASLFFSSLWHR